MTRRNRDLAQRRTGAVTAGAARPARPVTPARGGTVLHRVVPAQLACRIGARPLIIALVAAWGLGFGAVPVAAQSWMARAMPANVEGGLALFVSALQGSLAAGSAAGGVIYDTSGPRGALVLAAAVAAAGSLTLLGRAGAAISSPPAGPADLAGGRGRDAPAPPPGTTGGAGKNAQRTR
jgi:predicted MFS family arabinose efflux permease